MTRAKAVRPILKWAGGKRQLLPELRPFYPSRFERYLEPFLGSGAVFLDLYNGGRLAGPSVSLSDVNADVIGCYRTVRDDADAVIAALHDLEFDFGRQGTPFSTTSGIAGSIRRGGGCSGRRIRLAPTPRSWRRCSSS